jgi:hypothetical protein
MKSLLIIVAAAGAAVSAHAQPTIIARTNTAYPTLPPARSWGLPSPTAAFMNRAP